MLTPASFDLSLGLGLGLGFQVGEGILPAGSNGWLGRRLARGRWWGVDGRRQWHSRPGGGGHLMAGACGGGEEEKWLGRVGKGPLCEAGRQRGGEATASRSDGGGRRWRVPERKKIGTLAWRLR